MRTWVLFIFLNLLLLNLFSQGQEYQRTISWRNSIELQNGFYKLKFDNAVYFDSISKLPYYYEQFENRFSVIAKVSNLVIEKIDSATACKIYKPEQIPDTFLIKQFHGSSRKVNVISLQVLPIFKNKFINQFYRLISFSVLLIPDTISQSTASSRQYASHSVLNSGKWYKIRLKTDGIYRLTSGDIKNMGFSSLANIRIFGNGGVMLSQNVNALRPDDLKENPVELINGNDYILFYGKGPNAWSYDSTKHIFKHQQNKFSDYSYYFVTEISGTVKTIDTLPTPTAGNLINVESFNDYAFHEDDDINLFKSGAEWYGDPLMNASTYSLPFNFPNTDTSIQGKFYYDVIARASSSSNFSFNISNLNFNSKSIDPINYGSTEDAYANDANGIVAFKPTSDDVISNITYNNSSDPSAMGYINYFGVNLRRKLIISSQQIIFRDINSVGAGNLANFKIENASSDFEVWDITDYISPHKISTQLNNSVLSFAASSDTLRQYIVFSTISGILAPDFSGAGTGLINNQDIHGIANPQMVIIAPEDTGIKVQAKRLAQYRRQHDNLNVFYTTISQVYNEFSSGRRDVTAIRDMMKMFYDRSNTSQEIPKYLLLFGDGTFDNKVDHQGNNNLLPTYESAESLTQIGSYVSDDYFGWLGNTTSDANNLLDVGIGRLTVKDSIEARIVTDKIIAYDSPSAFGEWRNKLTFLADDGSGGTDGGTDDWEFDTDSLCRTVASTSPNFIIQKVYNDSYQMVKTSLGNTFPDVNTTINNAVDKGTLIMNYIGHSNENQLSHAVIIDESSIKSWNNPNKYFLFFTASCEFSRFDEADIYNWTDITSAGEKILLDESSGGIALFSTTRIVYSDGNFLLNQNFYKHIFSKDSNNNYLRLGDVMLLSKNSINDGRINKLNFSLLGDPSLTLAYPKDTEIITDSINHKPINYLDTLNALGFAHISGHLKNKNKFNGIINAAVFDKEYEKTTLGNAGNQLFTYTTRDNIIFKGQATVKNGNFEFNFPIPKDIQYNIGNGKIVYYATDSVNDAAGYTTDFKVGGFDSNNSDYNTEGPVIHLFMNDTNFIDGGITSPNPNLVVKLFDKNGINATGNGIGHDITAILDSDISNMFILDDYYIADIDKYQSGTAIYPFNSLSFGEHTISVTAWDIFNNSSTSEIKFNVVDNSNIILQNIENYPNPFNFATNFVFDFNWPNQNIAIEIRIYSITGQLLKIIKESGAPTGFRISPITWYGDDNVGRKLKSGIYLYKIHVAGSDSQQANGYGKAVIVR